MARVTVEDCLHYVPNRFALVHLGVKRARQLMKDAEPLLETDNKECVTALREVSSHRITSVEPMEDVVAGRLGGHNRKRTRRRR